MTSSYLSICCMGGMRVRFKFRMLPFNPCLRGRIASYFFACCLQLNHRYEFAFACPATFTSCCTCEVQSVVFEFGSPVSSQISDTNHHMYNAFFKLISLTLISVTLCFIATETNHLFAQEQPVKSKEPDKNPAKKNRKNYPV